MTLFLVSVECVGHNLPEAREDEDDNLNDGDHGGPQVETQVTSNHPQEIIQPLNRRGILLYSQTKGVKQKYSQFICHSQQDTVIWNAITTL